ncbi:MAG TPA: BON domain-containing protein [Candidatus Binatia bacterium]|nr:BON domain-containing protein [Candidatus Binatia bacterium]
MKQLIAVLMIAGAVAACSGPEDSDTTGPGMRSADGAPNDDRGLVKGDSADDKRTANAARDVEGRNMNTPGSPAPGAQATAPAGNAGTGTDQRRAMAPAPGADSDPNRYQADNSGKNVRDRNETAKTADDQSNTTADVTITQEIRKAVVANDSLSTNAQNVKIITENGVVTLRGPVSTAEEKAAVAATAQRVAGVKRVQNEIEIATSN